MLDQAAESFHLFLNGARAKNAQIPPGSFRNWPTSVLDRAKSRFRRPILKGAARAVGWKLTAGPAAGVGRQGLSKSPVAVNSLPTLDLRHFASAKPTRNLASSKCNLRGLPA